MTAYRSAATDLIRWPSAANKEVIMNNEEKNAANETTAADNDTKGLDYLTRLSYACVDRSDLNYEEKRNLLFALSF